MLNTFIYSIWRNFFHQLQEVFNVQRNLTELLTLRPLTKIFMLVMLIVNCLVFGLVGNFSILAWISFLTTLATVLNLILVDQGRLTNYSWGILSCVVWLVIACHNHLIGDIAAQLFYFVMQFVGLSVWGRQLDNTKQNELPPKKVSWGQLSMLLGLLFLIYGLVLLTSRQLHGAQIYLDATLLPLGIVGQILMTYGYRSQWIIWILLDSVNIIIWYRQLATGNVGTESMFALQIIILINSLYGAYLWFKPQVVHAKMKI
ncbi:nicotinamide riboside transporter PnuC [Periweissella beninensis]|uniref:nicotinamide riboside transporter PnuC n=1 Tax=Periweissella beninensis TaxID=504936 RepID=UPI0021A26F13|nr:nicotinamide riboside transporter PnuC [Periweissella beninensis]MCT4396448.1 ribosyl nicotinamide transporter [Periweissella beninensis]